MKIHRFIVDYKLVPGRFVVSDSDLVRQMGLVLKLKPGEAVIISDGQGNEASGKLEKIDAKQVFLRLEEPKVCDNEPATHVTLCCAVLKRENFEWVVQKATEVGVKKIIPLITERTVKQSLRMDRARSIAKEAAEQSGRCVVPEIVEPQTLEQAFSLTHNHRKIFYHVGETAESTVGNGSVALFVGPEGGWTEGEAAFAKDAGCEVCSLGRLVLRGETAAVCAAYQAVNARL